MSWSGWYLRNSSISAILRSVIGVVTPFRWLVVLLLEGNAPVTFSVNHRPDSTAFLRPTWDTNSRVHPGASGKHDVTGPPEGIENSEVLPAVGAKCWREGTNDLLLTLYGLACPSTTGGYLS